MSSENDRKIVVAGRYIDVRRAEFALSVLAGHDIDAFIDVPYTSSMFPHYMLNDGGVAVLVHEEDAQRAADLLHAEGTPATACHVCGAPVPDTFIAEPGGSPESDVSAEFVFLNTERGGHFAICGTCCDGGKFADLSPDEIAYVQEQVKAMREDRDV